MIRSKANRPMYSFDDLTRAREFLKTQQRKVGGLRLFKVTQIEEELPCGSYSQ
jgi:hypothetical protein